MQHLLQAFLPKQHLMVVWLNRAMIVLCEGFCYIKDIRIYIVIWIIYNNVATEITCLQKNMVALQNLALSENSAALWIHPPPPLSFWNLAPKAIFFSAPPPSLSFCQGVHLWLSLEVIFVTHTENLSVVRNDTQGPQKYRHHCK